MDLMRIALLAALCALANVATAQAVYHDLTMELDSAAGTLSVQDRVTLPAGSAPQFTLDAGLQARVAEYEVRETAGSDPASGVRTYRVALPDGVRSFTLSYRGRLSQGREANVSADNVVLGPESAWYADFAGMPVRFSLHVRLPERWHCVSQGRAGDRPSPGEETWTADTPQQGIYLIAAAFVRYEGDTPWGRSEVFLRTADDAMAQRYLDATARYVAMYSDLIGAYPYSKFALVENAQQTGYGMPSFTLLGSRVIRLPFIVHTSYPHEILHNWWGNGVWVAYDGGNWAEALTTYLSDYLLAEQDGHGAAQRRAALQKYADFVATNNDFPLRRFRARHGEASQAIGYSKGMMFFHMLRRRLGDAQFVAALRDFYRQYRFQPAGFDDLETVFERTSNEKLGAFFGQWLQRSGAPALTLGKVAVQRRDAGYELRLTLRQRQSGAVYDLQIPVAVQVEGRQVAQLRTVSMDRREQTFELRFNDRPLQMAVDPAFDVFRRLDRGELPPSLGRLLGAARAVFVIPSAAPAQMRAAYRRLAQTWAGPQDRIVDDDRVGAVDGADAIWVLGHGNRLRSRVLASAGNLPLQVDGDTVRIDGRMLNPDDRSIVLATPAAGPATFGWIDATSADAVAALARKLPHYSRFGYLAFAGPDTANVSKGEWPVTDSPLQRRLVTGDAAALKLPERPPLMSTVDFSSQAPH